MALRSLLFLSGFFLACCEQETFYGFRTLSNPVELSIPVTFYGQIINELRVSQHGLISLGGSNYQDTPQTLPFVTSPGAEGRILAVFWTKHQAVANKVTYEQTTDPDVLDQVNQDIAQYFYCIPSTPVTWVFKAKWHQVQSLPDDFSYNPCYYTVVYAVYYYYHLPSSYYQLEIGDFFGYICNREPSNTYEVTLASNGIHTFLFYKYERIEWGGGDGQRLAECGINEGNGVLSQTVTGSGTWHVLDLPDKSNVGTSGLFAYRVDSDASDTPCHGRTEEDTFYGFRTLSDPVELFIPVPFYGHIINELRSQVSQHGLISLGGSNAQDTPQTLPFATSPEAEGRILAVFWTKHQAAANKVTYEQTTDPHVLDQVSQDIAKYFYCISNTPVTWVFKAKWHQVQSLPNEIDHELCYYYWVYSISFYYHLPNSFTTSTVWNYYGYICNSDCGINGGNGVLSQTLSGSGKPQVMDLSSSSNVREPGLFAYQVSDGMNSCQTCACHVTNRIVAFNKTEFAPTSDFAKQRITLAESTLDDDVCRLRVAVVVSAQAGNYRLKRVLFFFGRHEKEPRLYGLRLKFGNNKPRITFRDGTQQLLNLDSPFEYTDPEGPGPDIRVSLAGGVCYLGSPSCLWGLRYYPTADYATFIPGDPGPYDNMCGDCD